MTGQVIARTQADVDALLGCEEIDGGLFIVVSAEEWQQVDLAALGALRVVHGRFRVEGAASLVGLEALEQVNELQLVSLPDVDLTPLSHLRSGVLENGEILIEKCNGLRDLRGLENLTEWLSLVLSSNAALESLAGLQAPRRLNRVSLMDLPALRDVSALAPALEMDELVLNRTGVEDLPLSLINVNTLGLISNWALADLDGLIVLTVGLLAIEDNDSLVKIDLPGLDSIQDISITGNDALRSVPGYNASIDRTGGKHVLSFRQTGSKPDRFEVSSNALLESITWPAGYAQVQKVKIANNPSLKTLDLSQLREADGMLIADNGALSEVQTTDLDRVGDLWILNNPALSTAAFSDVQTFSRNVSGNLEDPQL